MAESDRRPGESERDWNRRLAELGARAQREHRDRQRQQSANAAAEEAEIREALGDEVWLHGAVQDLFGLTPDQLEKRLQDGQKAKNWDSFDAAVLAGLESAKKSRWFEGKKARNKRVAKYLGDNKKKITKAAKKGKRGFFSW